MNKNSFILMLCCLALTNFCSVASNALPKPDETKTKIVFQREAGFYVMNADGRAQEMLPRNKLFVGQVLYYGSDTTDYRILSPDGKFILYVESIQTKDSNTDINAKGVSDAKKWYLNSKDVLTGKHRHLLQLFGTTISSFSISPDSKHIAFITRDEDNRGYSTNLQIMDINGKHIKSLAATPKNRYVFYDSYVAFSPDGKTLSFLRVEDIIEWTYISYSINLDGSELTPLKNEFSHLSSSNAKRRVAYTGYKNGSLEIFAAKMDDTDHHQLTNNKAKDFNPVFSPDGKQIAFVSDRDGNNEIYVMNADGSGQKRLTKNKVDDNFPQWRSQQNIQ